MQAEELEHELVHRENMLKMLIFNKENRDKSWTEFGGHVPPYTSCPNLKKEPHRYTALSPSQDVTAQQIPTPSAYLPLLINQSQTPQFDDRTRFDYNRYM